MLLNPKDNILVRCNCINHSDKRLFGSYVTHAGSFDALRADARFMLMCCLSRFRSENPEFKHSSFEYVISCKVTMANPTIEHSFYYLPKFLLSL